MRVADGTTAYPAWNHAEFRVTYPSLSRHLCLAGIYIQLLLEGIDQVLATSGKVATGSCSLAHAGFSMSQALSQRMSLAIIGEKVFVLAQCTSVGAQRIKARANPFRSTITACNSRSN